MPKYRGGNGPPVQGSALGKEGRKYGVGMGENCPFMHETTALKPTMNGVGMGRNCPFMHGTTALKPTMDGVGMGENCPFMHGKRLLYSIDLLGGGAGYLCRWGGSGKLGLRGDLVSRGRAICLVEKIRRAFRSGFCVLGKNVCLCGWGRLFYARKKVIIPH